MFRSVAQAAVAVAVAVVLAVLSGCGSDAQNDPFIVEKFSKIDAELNKYKDLPARVQTLNGDIDDLTMRVGQLSAAGGGAVPANIDKEIKGIQKAFMEIDIRLKELDARLARLEKGKPGAVKPVVVAPPAAVPGPKPPLPEARPPTTTGTATAVKPASKAPAAPAIPKGHSYVAVEGDTIESVAKKFGITVEDFLRANNYLKPDSPLLPNQRYWIPVPPKR